MEVNGAIELLRQKSEAGSSLVKHTDIKDICAALSKNEIVQTSALVGRKATLKEIAEFNIHVVRLFPKVNEFKIKELCRIITEEEWTKTRLDYTLRKMLGYEYQDFQVGQFINTDKTITFGRSELALRRNLKFAITQDDIVVVKLKRSYDDNGEIKQDFIRAYAYKEEAEDVMPDKIVGRWNEAEHCFDFFGTIENHETEIRKANFKKALFEYCDMPPRYNGKYKIEIVKSFFEYWSEPIPPGDMMRFENKMKFDVELLLEMFNKKFNNNQN